MMVCNVFVSLASAVDVAVLKEARHSAMHSDLFWGRQAHGSLTSSLECILTSLQQTNRKLDELLSSTAPSALPLATS